MVHENGDGAEPRRRARRAHARSPGRTARSSSRGRCTCSQTSPPARRRRTIQHGTRLSVFVFAAHRDRGICRTCVRGGVRRREDASLSHELRPLRRQHDHHDRQRPLRRRQRLLPLRHVARDPEPGDLLRRRLLAGERLLGVQGRAPADRGSVAGRDGDRCSASCRRSSGRSSTSSSVRRSTSRTSASASSRSARDGGAARPARVALPGVPRRGGARVPRLPGLHDQAEAGVRHLQGAARAALAGVPVLRDADRPPLARVRGDDGAPDDRSTSRCACPAARPAAMRKTRPRLRAATSRLRPRWRSSGHSS